METGCNWHCLWKTHIIILKCQNQLGVRFWPSRIILFYSNSMGPIIWSKKCTLQQWYFIKHTLLPFSKIWFSYADFLDHITVSCTKTYEGKIWHDSIPLHCGNKSKALQFQKHCLGSEEKYALREGLVV